MPLPPEKICTTDDIYALPDGERAELVDGQIYYMAPPSRKHQRISGELFTIINNYIKSSPNSLQDIRKKTQPLTVPSFPALQRLYIIYCL